MPPYGQNRTFGGLRWGGSARSSKISNVICLLRMKSRMPLPLPKLLLAALLVPMTAHPADAGTMPRTQAARNSLPIFLKIVSVRPAWASKFRVRAVVRDQDKSQEFFLSDFRRDASGYSAQLDTTPSMLKNVIAGQRVPVKIDDINDWTYDDSRDGTTHGHFGICAELQQLPRAESREQREYWSLSCKP